MRSGSICLCLLLVANLTACTTWRNMTSKLTGSSSNTVVDDSQAAAPNAPAGTLPAKVTAVGHGAPPTQSGLSPEQRRILTMRAAKYDALRALAETVAGFRITSNSTISSAMLTNDSFRVYVEAYVRGAQVVSIKPLPGGAYETIVELQLGPDFQRAATQAYGSSVSSANTHTPTTRVTMSSQPTAASAPLTSNSSNFYLAK